MRVQAIILSLLSTLISSASANEDKRPNIVLLVARELAREDLGCYGGGNASPMIDQLAKQGVRYETAWSMPDGVLSRKTLLSGRYPCHDAGASSFPGLLEKAG